MGVIIGQLEGIKAASSGREGPSATPRGHHSRERSRWAGERLAALPEGDEYSKG